MKTSLHFTASLFSGLALLLAGCATAFDVGPEYQRPEPEAPPSFRDDSSIAADFALSPSWWTHFHDPELASLIERALEHNRDLSAAAHRVDQARALAGQARADLFPQLSVQAQGGRQQGIKTAYQPTDYVQIPALLSYELDLWGSVRRGSSAVRAEADAEQLRYEAARLSLSAQVAETVYLLRAARIEEGIVAASVDTRREAREVIAAQHEQGSVGELDHARAETELAIAEAALESVALRRSQLTNALAVLVGEPAPTFSLADLGSEIPEPPSIPAGLPASVLQHRPDLAAAERQLAASADRIAVARATFYPSIRLTASGGWESGDFDDIFSGSREAWSIGPQLYLPLFQGGRNRAGLARARAVFEEQLATFEATALVALAEVQDALSSGGLIARQAAANQRAVVAARRSAALSRTRYDAGYVGYLEVVDSERVALSTERAQSQLNAQRLIATVNLVKALGGGWTESSNTLGSVE